jgi:integrase/recombinase XerD
VTRERIAAYLVELASVCAPYTQVCRIQELYDAMRVLAGKCDWSWLAQLLATLRCRAEPVRDKRNRLRPVGELIQLGRRLMTEAEMARGWSAQRRAVQYRDGLIIAVLAYRPVRLSNLAAIRLGQHLVEQNGLFWIIFSAAETKTHQRYEAIFPEALVPDLNRYLTRHRPELLKGEQKPFPAELDALWVSEVATPLDADSLANRIRKQTRRGLWPVVTATLVPRCSRDLAGNRGP